jgi:hypothetical protein
MWHAHAVFIFCLFLEYVLLFFSNVLYLHFFVDWWDVFMWTGNLRTYILFDKALANPNYIPVYMKVYYLFTLCLFKVGRLFSKLATPKYMFVFVIKLSKEKTYFMYGWTWEIEHKMCCLLLTWVSVILHLISTVVCQMSTLYCGGGGRGSRNISGMPRCRFNVLDVQLQKYIYYWSPEIFKSTFCSCLLFWFWDISPYWSLA